MWSGMGVIEICMGWFGLSSMCQMWSGFPRSVRNEDVGVLDCWQPSLFLWNWCWDRPTPLRNAFFKWNWFNYITTHPSILLLSLLPTDMMSALEFVNDIFAPSLQRTHVSMCAQMALPVLGVHLQKYTNTKIQIHMCMCAEVALPVWVAHLLPRH